MNCMEYNMLKISHLNTRMLKPIDLLGCLQHLKRLNLICWVIFYMKDPTWSSCRKSSHLATDPPSLVARLEALATLAWFNKPLASFSSSKACTISSSSSLSLPFLWSRKVSTAPSLAPFTRWATQEARCLGPAPSSMSPR